MMSGMKNLTRWAGVVVCGAGLLVVSAGAFGRQVVDLRPKFEAGKLTRYVLTQSSESVTAGAAGMPAPKNGAPGGKADSEGATTVWQEITFTLTPVTVNTAGEAGGGGGGGATVKMAYERVRMKITAGGQAVTEFDSDAAREKDGAGGAADPLAAAMRGLAGTTMTITIDGTGKISRVEGGGEGLGLAALLGDKAGMLPKDAIGSIVPGSGLEGGRAKVGESWSVTDGLRGSLLGDIAMVTTHTVRGVRGGLADVGISGTVRPESEGGGGEGLFAVRSAATEGDYRWDTKAGELESMRMKQSVEMDSTALGEAVRMKSESKTEIRRVGGKGAGEKGTGEQPRTGGDDGFPPPRRKEK